MDSFSIYFLQKSSSRPWKLWRWWSSYCCSGFSFEASTFNVKLNKADNHLYTKWMAFFWAETSTDGGKNTIDVARGVFLHKKCLFVVWSTPLDEIMQDGCIAMQNVSLDTSVTLSSAYTDMKKWRWRRILYIVEDLLDNQQILHDTNGMFLCIYFLKIKLSHAQPLVILFRYVNCSSIPGPNRTGDPSFWHLQKVQTLVRQTMPCKVIVISQIIKKRVGKAWIDVLSQKTYADAWCSPCIKLLSHRHGTFISPSFPHVVSGDTFFG